MSGNARDDHHALVEILDSWLRLRRLLLLFSFIFAIAGGLVYLILYNLRSSASEIQLSATHFVFKQSSRQGEDYFVIVPPQGWQRTSVHIPDGASVSFEAGGAVNVDLSGLMNALRARSEAELRVNALNNPKCAAPEDCFTPLEKQVIIPRWSWVGPDGVPAARMQALANPVRWKRSILPDAPYGTLVGGFHDTDVDPSLPEVARSLAKSVFAVRRVYKLTAHGERSGYLYLAVNDVQSRDPNPPEMFSIDNIGTFYVKVSVRSK